MDDSHMLPYSRSSALYSFRLLKNIFVHTDCNVHIVNSVSMLFIVYKHVYVHCKVYLHFKM